MFITRKIALATIAAFGLSWSTAQAGVGISIGFPAPHYHHRPCYGHPYYGYRYYAPPPRPVYVYPAPPAYVYPAPVYVQPAPVAYIAPPPPLPVAPAPTVPVPAY